LSYGERVGMPGHVFNVVNDGGVIRFVDGQVGTTASFDGFSRLNFLRIP
jgi:hypothetical protein